MPKKAKNSAIPDALKHFDSLPDSAHVRLPVVQGLYGCSVSGVWRAARKGIIPKPYKVGERCSAWNVGELRRDLASKGVRNEGG
jgi:predicted DNA-binding transcriptional regulator AlpA